FAPNEAKYKFYIIDEAHQITKDAFDALLKTFEEPPGHVIFVLATTDPNKVPPTILSRCQRFDFRRLSLADLRAGLSEVCASEEVTAEPAALDLLARAAEGSSRDSLSLLDQAIAFCGPHITEEQVRTMLGMASSETIDRLVDALLQRDAKAGLTTINQAIDAGVDPRGLNRELVEYLRRLLLMQVNGAIAETIDASQEELDVLRTQLGEVSTEALIRQIKTFSDADYAFRNAAQAQLPLEIALLEAIRLAVTSSGVPGAAGSANVELRTTGPAPAPARPAAFRSDGQEASAPAARAIKETAAPLALSPAAASQTPEKAHTDDAPPAPEPSSESEARTPAAAPKRSGAEPGEAGAVVVGSSAADALFESIVAKWPRVLEIVRD
ncbi:MAG: AAA family ATPase, partial [Chloroflexota bacterium]|nr:AAA family ATPase [Chloroflexota bacterium]